MSKGKVVAVVFVCAFLLAPAIYAGDKTNPDTGQAYGMAGCGWGSTFHGHKGRGGQLLASTTNSTFANQTFGITMGTSNCSDRKSKKHAAVQNYIESNRIAFTNDVARGNGETITGLSQILGCTDTVTLGHSLKVNYEAIFPELNVGSAYVTESVVKTIEDRSQLICAGV